MSIVSTQYLSGVVNVQSTTCHVIASSRSNKEVINQTKPHSYIVMSSSVHYLLTILVS